VRAGLGAPFLFGALCNSSKGSQTVSEWIESSYCKKRGINTDTVAEVVRLALRADGILARHRRHARSVQLRTSLLRSLIHHSPLSLRLR
jgi:hypothetical protein